MILHLESDQVIKLTFLAVLIRWHDRNIWLPKSQILMTVGVDTVRVLVPEWLAKARGI